MAYISARFSEPTRYSGGVNYRSYRSFSEIIINGIPLPLNVMSSPDPISSTMLTFYISVSQLKKLRFALDRGLLSTLRSNKKLIFTVLEVDKTQTFKKIGDKFVPYPKWKR